MDQASRFLYSCVGKISEYASLPEKGIEASAVVLKSRTCSIANSKVSGSPPGHVPPTRTCRLQRLLRTCHTQAVGECLPGMSGNDDSEPGLSGLNWSPRARVLTCASASANSESVGLRINNATATLPTGSLSVSTVSLRYITHS